MWERNMDPWSRARLQPGTWSATQAHALNGNLTGDFSVCGMTPKQLSHTSQGKVLSTFEKEKKEMREGYNFLTFYWLQCYANLHHGSNNTVRNTAIEKQLLLQHQVFQIKQHNQLDQRIYITLCCTRKKSIQST